MANKSIRRESDKVEKLIDVEQICNEFRLVGTTQAHVLKRYKGEQKTKINWLHLFRQERIL